MKHVPVLNCRHCEVEEAVSNKSTTNQWVRDRAGELIAVGDAKLQEAVQLKAQLKVLQEAAKEDSKQAGRLLIGPE